MTEKLVTNLSPARDTEAKHRLLDAVGGDRTLARKAWRASNDLRVLLDSGLTFSQADRILSEAWTKHQSEPPEPALTAEEKHAIACRLAGLDPDGKPLPT